jgi:hypothetical protein
VVKQTGQRLAVRDGHFEGLGGQGVRQERFHSPANYQPPNTGPERRPNTTNLQRYRYK